ncbi:MAG: DUF4391 domain-containing protein [Isosphaeraceae bacterium]|jgi:hypothetical protein
MSARAIIAALALPPEARVDERVPKKMLVEQSDPTAADRRQILEGIDELLWLAALKPSNIGVAEYRDQAREYLEIAVLTVALRPTARAPRLTELIHRAIPYPVVLVTSQGGEVSLSLAHKRFSQNEVGATVLDGALIASPPISTQPATVPDHPDRRFLDSLPLAVQPRVHLCAVYQGWVERAEALQAARLTGRFVLAPTSEVAAVRRNALVEYDRIQREITSLRARAEKETQINRRVEFNLAIRRLDGELALAAKNL